MAAINVGSRDVVEGRSLMAMASLIESITPNFPQLAHSINL